MSGTFPRLIAPLGGALLAWGLLVPAVLSGQEDPSWAGKRIILGKDGVRIGHTADNGKPVYVGNLTDMVYRVPGCASARPAPRAGLPRTAPSCSRTRFPISPTGFALTPATRLLTPTAAAPGRKKAS